MIATSTISTNVWSMDKHFFLLTDFFFIHRNVLEINRLDKIARRSKRVGGAIADLWDSHLVGTYYMHVVEKLSEAEKSLSPGDYEESCLVNGTFSCVNTLTSRPGCDFTPPRVI